MSLQDNKELVDPVFQRIHGRSRRDQSRCHPGQIL